MKPLSIHTVLVTGTSRGVGKGIALARAEAGATGYITGWTVFDQPVFDVLPCRPEVKG